VTDAFELEEQLSPNKKAGGSAGGSNGLPFVPETEAN